MLIFTTQYRMYMTSGVDLKLESNVCVLKDTLVLEKIAGTINNMANLQSVTKLIYREMSTYKSI